MALELDVRFQKAIAEPPARRRRQPDARARDARSAVEKRARTTSAARRASTGDAAGATRRRRATRSTLPVLGAAPDFTGNQRWFNTPGDRPLTLAALRGRVVLIDFWTYTCINCIRTLPVPEGVGRALPRRRADDRRRPLARVRLREGRRQRRRARSARTACAIRSRRTTSSATWNAWGNQYWPAEYLIDARGKVRYAHFGEGDYDKTEARDPLAARRARRHALGAHGAAARPPSRPGARRRRRRPTSAPRAPSAGCRPSAARRHARLPPAPRVARR